MKMPNSFMKIALTSMDIVWEDKSVNQEKCAELIKRASESGARLILFPEMTLTGFTMDVRGCGETEGRCQHCSTVAFFLEQSERYRMAVGFGYIHREDEKGTNHFVVADKGKIIADYTKIHPFSYGGEDRVYNSGSQLVSAELDGIRMGLFICYDLRFPEIFQVSSEDCEVLAVIANWPRERIHHWHCLLPARAIENQSVVLGVNRRGWGGGIEYVDSSEAYDCEGNRIPCQRITTKAGDDCLLCEIDVHRPWQLRREFPVKQDRRKKWYKSL